jgi:hypothetical protein
MGNSKMDIGISDQKQLDEESDKVSPLPPGKPLENVPY